jgi:hypothetical protein
MNVEKSYLIHGHSDYAGRFIMYSGITKNYHRKTVGNAFTVIFFLWGNVKNLVFVPPLPRDFVDLKAWIIAAVRNIDAPMLTHVW